MKIGVIDAELLFHKSHRFPNLACMKIAGYWKAHGHDVKLLDSYEEVHGCGQVYISKVFTDTAIPEEVLRLPNVRHGGTGFFYDKAPKLPEEIEHHMPDYALYEVWLEAWKAAGEKKVKYQFYRDYSIGFLTRGCFRGCPFCVNKDSRTALSASPLSEFLSTERKKIYLLDDNFLACKDWERLLDELAEVQKPVQFRQGLDLRMMTRRQMIKLFRECKLDGNVIFAFDDIRDKDIIERKLRLLYETVPIKKKELKLYVLCGFDRNNQWDRSFWVQDLYETLERIRFLMKYGCLPYIMRFEKYRESEYRGMYITISRWCNQPAQFSKKSLREFCESEGENSSSCRYLHAFEKEYSEFAPYFDMQWENENKMG